MTQSNEIFKKLREVKVVDKVEKKGQFNYLSWADAVDYLLEIYPQSTWKVHEWDNLPFTGTPDNGYMVAVTVCIWDKAIPIERTQYHPVLNHSNKTIFKPNAFEINTAIQRCLAKAIALHGLGLSLYTGEDLQEPPNSPKKPPVAPTSPDKKKNDPQEDDKYHSAMEGQLKRLGKEEFNAVLYACFDIKDGNYKTITDKQKREDVWNALNKTTKEAK